MKNHIIAYIFLFILITISSYFLPANIQTKIIEEHQKIRSSIFTAFITMGTFNLSLVSMFMFSLKKELFDSVEYEKQYLSHKELFPETKSKYEPLIQVSRLFLFAIIMCYFTSILQVTLGLVENFFTVAICLAVSTATLLLLMYILIIVWLNYEKYFTQLKKTS